MSHVFGIDLGTTFSVIAQVDDAGRAVVIPNAEGNHITPSAVWFDGDTRVVGQTAKENAVLYPDDVVTFVKRHMGEAGWIFTYQGNEYTPEEVSSYILRKLATDAAEATGEPVTDAVITCPAYFGPSEREATALAGKIAGLNVRAIINEPTAAAISYGMHSAGNQVVMIYDLGGGTFDVTIIEIKDGAFTVIATGGNHRLGGGDWDMIVLNYLADQWMEQTGSAEHPLSDPETAQDLTLRAERAKIALSAAGKTEVEVPVAFNGTRKGIKLSREKFDELTAPLLEQTIVLTHDMLNEAAKKGVTRFDQILLVGGSTRMPQVRERLKQEFGGEPRWEDPDEAVAKGAALYAQSLALGDAIKGVLDQWNATGKKGTEEQKEKEAKEKVSANTGMSLPAIEKLTGTTIKIVTSRSFGVVALDEREVERVTNIILVNATLPAEATQTFGTVQANQRSADIRVVENIVPETLAEVADSKEIGNAELSLPPNLPRQAPIQVTFRLDEQGLLHATGVDLTGRRTISVDIKTDRVMSEEQLEEAMKRSRGLKITG
jgi:molecular chaperone DnaK (HSP70)